MENVPYILIVFTAYCTLKHLLRTTEISTLFSNLKCMWMETLDFETFEYSIQTVCHKFQ